MRQQVKSNNVEKVFYALLKGFNEDKFMTIEAIAKASGIDHFRGSVTSRIRDMKCLYGYTYVTKQKRRAGGSVVCKGHLYKLTGIKNSACRDDKSFVFQPTGQSKDNRVMVV